MKTSGKNTQECLCALLDSDTGATGRMLARLKTRMREINNWRVGKGPMGFKLVRLRVYLAEQGYVPAEFADIDRDVIEFGRSIAHNFVTEEGAPKIAGLTAADSLLRILHGKINTSRTTIDCMRQSNARLNTTLKPFEYESKEDSSRGQTSAMFARSLSPMGKDAAFISLAHVVCVARPFVDAIGPDELSEAQKKQFRESAGYDSLVKLSTFLNRVMR